MAYGTYAINDSLGVLANNLNVQISTLDPVKIYEIIQQDLAYHNELVNNELLPNMCAITDKPEYFYGIRDFMTVEQLDEFGRPNAQKVTGGTTLGLPLYRYGRAVQWTRDALNVMTLGELVEQYNAMKAADLNAIRINIARRIFNATNTLNYVDRLVNNRTLRLRAFYNGDGEQVMPSPTFTQFAGTHTHFNTTSSGTVTGAQVTALINNVLEHGHSGGNLVLYINQAQLAVIRTMTAADEFTPFTDVRIRQSANTTYAVSDNLVVESPEDRAVGIFGAATVWVKPYIPAGYLLAMDLGVGTQKPLGFRTRENGVYGDFNQRGDTYSGDFPLYTQYFARDYGIGVINRHMAAVLQINVSPVYTAPVI